MNNNKENVKIVKEEMNKSKTILKRIIEEKLDNISKESNKK